MGLKEQAWFGTSIARFPARCPSEGPAYHEPVTSAGYLRFPHIHGDLVAFVADDDVWLAPASGGRAWRVTADHAVASHPRISRDGTMIAWTSGRDGQPEVYLAGIDGGNGRRLSYWGDAGTQVCGWTPDGEVLAITAAGQPFRRQTAAHALPAAGDGGERDGGGPPRALPFGLVSHVAMETAGVALLTGSFREPAHWKRYRGGTAGKLWVRPAGAGSGFTRLLGDVAGQFASPMLVGGRLAFLSDYQGTGNLYSCALDGSDLRRHTDHDGHYARNASTDGQRIVYHCAGDVWVLDSLDTEEARRLEFGLSAPAARAPQLISAEDHLGSLSCDYSGQASAVEVCGTVHWLTHREGPARALSVVPGVRARLPRVLGRTGQVAWVTDAEGADAIEITAADGPTAQTAPRPPTAARSRSQPATAGCCSSMSRRAG